MRTSIRSLLSLLALLAATLPTIGGDPAAEVQPWLEKLARISNGTAYTVNYAMKMDMRSMGQQVAMDMRGELKQADRKHMRMDMKMSVSMPGMGEMASTMLGVADGETMWMQMENPMMGGMQVMKMDLATMEKVGGRGGAPGFGGGNMGMDPLSQVEQMTKVLDFQDVTAADGAVNIRARVKQEALAQMGMADVNPDDGTVDFSMVLDEKTGFPRLMLIGPEGAPWMSMEFENLQIVDRDSFGAETFSYSAPEGVPVIDVGAMMGTGGDEEPEQ